MSNFFVHFISYSYLIAFTQISLQWLLYLPDENSKGLEIVVVPSKDTNSNLKNFNLLNNKFKPISNFQIKSSFSNITLNSYIDSYRNLC